MTVMISQPMGGFSDDEILATRDRVSDQLHKLGHEVMDTFYGFEYAVYFCKGWENARGCVIEHSAAQAYGLQVFYE